jgi:hypothetical protein
MPDIHITQWHGNHPVGMTTTVTPQGMYGLFVLIFGLCGGAIGAYIPQLWVETPPSWSNYAAMGFGFLCIGRVGMLTLISLGLMFRLILLIGLLYLGALALYSGKITSSEIKKDWVPKTDKFPGSAMVAEAYGTMADKVNSLMGEVPISDEKFDGQLAGHWREVSPSNGKRLTYHLQRRAIMIDRGSSQLLYRAADYYGIGDHITVKINNGDIEKLQIVDKEHLAVVGPKGKIILERYDPNAAPPKRKGKMPPTPI